MGFGAILKDLLADKNMSIKELSEATGIPLNTLYSITKRDTINVRQETLAKISHALDVPTDDMLQMLRSNIEVTKHELERLQYRLMEAEHLHEQNMKLHRRNMELRRELSQCLRELTHYSFNDDDIDIIIATAVLIKEPPTTE